MLNLASLNRAKFSIKSYSVEHGYPSRRRSLVGDAKFETLKNREAKLTWLEEQRKSLDQELSEDEVLVVTQVPDEQAILPIPTNILLSLKEGFSSLSRILKIIEACKGKISHIESRKIEKQNYYDVYIKLDIPKDGLLHVIKSLRQGNLADVSVLREQHISIKDPWFPRHISDLDYCHHLMTKYEPELDSDHPGFTDKNYRERRKKIAQIAFDYKYGQPIPRIQYTEEEINTWRYSYNELVKLLPTHAYQVHTDVLHLLEKECGYSPDNIPQLEDVSQFLKKRTGWTIRPAAGLLTSRDFLASLAFRVFQTTQYIRHSSSPNWSPEPDCIHELLGHVPILADPSFAQFSQEIGLATLGASDEEIEKFATLYWFTVEFGLCKQGNEIRAYGAGLLSSFGELEHSLSGKPDIREFDPEKTSVQPYQDVDYQNVYYVADSFDDAKEKVRQYVHEKLPRRYEIYYDALTQTVNVLDSVDKLDKFSETLKDNVTKLCDAVRKIK